MAIPFARIVFGKQLLEDVVLSRGLTIKASRNRGDASRACVSKTTFNEEVALIGNDWPTAKFTPVRIDCF